MTRLAFDLRDPTRSGIARVARSTAHAVASSRPLPSGDLLLAGPVDQLERLGARDWGLGPTLIPWTSGRLSVEAEFTWPEVRRRVGPAVWYFPHFDMPWTARVSRSMVVLHDLIALHVPGATTRLRSRIARHWIARSGRRATRILVGTRFTRAEIIEQWPDLAPKIEIVPHGVEERFFDAAPALPADIVELLEGQPFMLSVGNRKPHKNLEMGAEVLARLPWLRWVVIGERFRGWDGVSERIERLGVGDRVHVLDPRPDEVLHALYAASSCLLFPSRHEGFGLPILEALAAGTRVVSGNAGACVEVLAGHGVVCDCDDADAFAAAVSGAVQAGRPGPAGRAHAARFTWQATAAAVLAIADAIAE